MILIVFEGICGSGKTALTKHLTKKYPFCVRIGEVIDRTGKEMSYEEKKGKSWRFFVRSDFLKIKIARKFKNKIILLDRWYPSTLLHVLTEKIIKKNAPLEKIIKSYKKISKIRNLEVIYVYLDVPVEKSLKRSNLPYDDIHRNIEHLTIEKLCYDLFFLNRDNVIVISANRSLKQNLSLIRKKLFELRKKL